jgi:hypothetical protein
VSTLLPGPGVELEVCLGIGTVQPGGVWDAGTFDYNTWQQTDTALGDWTDVTCDVIDQTIRSAAGSSPDGVVTRWEAATLNFALIGAVFDPRSGPYAGLLGPGLPVRMRWRPAGADQWIIGFAGYVDDDGFSYDPAIRQAGIAATDGTRIFAGYDGVEQPPAGAGETAADRVARIADLVGWPAGARDIDPGGVAVQSTTLAQAAWTLLLAVADTDLALLWLTRAGLLAYRPQGKIRPSRELAAVIGCDVADPPAGVTVIEPVNLTGQQPTITRNVVSISRQARDENDTPVTVTVRDEPSIARFLPHSYQRTDLIHYEDDWSSTVADAVLAAGAWPSTAPAAADLSSRVDPAASALLLGLEPSLAVSVVDDTGTAWSCEPAGWDITISRAEIAGRIDLLDVSVWTGSAWDGGDGWDLGKWGY